MTITKLQNFQSQEEGGLYDEKWLRSCNNFKGLKRDMPGTLSVLPSLAVDGLPQEAKIKIKIFIGQKRCGLMSLYTFLISYNIYIILSYAWVTP